MMCVCEETVVLCNLPPFLFCLLTSACTGPPCVSSRQDEHGEAQTSCTGVANGGSTVKSQLMRLFASSIEHNGNEPTAGDISMENVMVWWEGYHHPALWPWELQLVVGLSGGSRLLLRLLLVFAHPSLLLPPTSLLLVTAPRWLLECSGTFRPWFDLLLVIGLPRADG